MRHLVVRIFVLLDLAMCANPLWAWFLVWRWTGRRLGVRGLSRWYVQALRFVVAHFRHARAGGGIGAWAVDWRSPPVRRASFAENTEWSQKGSCGTCRQCCSTVWLPEPEQVNCPMLTENGCGVYGGVFWDFFNCGRFPVNVAWVESYSCPRFERAVVRRLPVVPAAKVAADGESNDA